MNEELRNIWLSFFNWVMGNGPRPENEVIPPEPPPALPFTQRPKDKYSRFHEATLRERYDQWLEIHGLHLFSVIYSGLSVLTCIVIVSMLLAAVAELPPFGHELNSSNNEVIQRYVQHGAHETGAQNIISGLLLSYRAFDSLGALIVLFTSAISVLMLLGGSRNRDHVLKHDDSILSGTVSTAIPVIFMLGCVLIMSGHLSPGGGFQGGAVLSIALILAANAYGFERVHEFFSKHTLTISLSAALMAYTLIKGCIFFTGANQLDMFIPKGTLGEFLSAGFILPLNICMGIIAVCILYGFYALFSEGEI